jgi:pimeloyl-ACP methyl ester carboxylesterase
MDAFYRLLTGVFDKGSELYQIVMKAAVTAPIPDLSDKSVAHIVTPEDKADPDKFYAPPTAVPDIPMKRVFQTPFLDIYDGGFTSPIVSPFPVNNKIWVRHFRLPKNGIGGPTVIMIHGWKMADYTYFDWWCWRFAAWGFNSIMLDMPYHMKRTPEGSFSGQLLLTEDTLWNLAALKQSFVDTHAVANWLQANGAGPIGTFGVSYGAFVAGLFACRADNSDFAILGMPPMDTMKVLESTELGDLWRKEEAAGRMSMLSDPDIPPIYNLCEQKLRIPKEKMFIAMGTLDHLVEPDSVRETARLWGGLPWLREYPTGHINTFALNFAFIEDARKFLKKEVLL